MRARCLADFPGVRCLPQAILHPAGQERNHEYGAGVRAAGHCFSVRTLVQTPSPLSCRDPTGVGLAYRYRAEVGSAIRLPGLGTTLPARLWLRPESANVVCRSSPTLIRRYGGQAGGTGAAEHFAVKAVDLINSSLDAPTLAEIQALCLIIIHEWGSRNAVRAYIYLGQAARMVQMYRILNSHHQQVESADRFMQEESFRRTVWLLYILDSLLVSTPGRYPAMSPADVADVSLPCSDINFAFGNAVYVKTLAGVQPSRMPPDASISEVGEFGHIIIATKIWRDVVAMLTNTSADNFNDATCIALLHEVETLRLSLPMQLVDKPGQINLHITMGSGFTYAMLHCLLNCSHIFVHRRRLLHYVTAKDFDIEAWKSTTQYHEIIDWLFTSCHNTLTMLTALESGSDKDSVICFPIFMLFSAFIASSTAAYLSLKGLTPPTAVETAALLVRDGLHFMADGAETWPLTISWSRHLTVMHRVLANDSNPAASIPLTQPAHQAQAPASVKDEAASNPDISTDAMDYDQQSNTGPTSQAPPSSMTDSGRGDSEPPVQAPRRHGVTTINGGSGGISTPATGSPPYQAGVKNSPDAASSDRMPTPPAGNGVPSAVPEPEPMPQQDMSATDLCDAFERQLLELDDLAAFMGGGV